MGKTVVGVNSPRAVKRFSGDLALDVSQASYFGKRFAAVGQGAKTPIQLLTDLESEAGDLVSYDLLAELRMAPVEGDDVLEGKEEGQRFYTDELYIDQARGGVNTGGRMSRKRTLHDLRMRAKQQQANWWGRFQDELTFTYLSGSRGINANFIALSNSEGRLYLEPVQKPAANMPTQNVSRMRSTMDQPSIAASTRSAVLAKDSASATVLASTMSNFAPLRLSSSSRR